MTRPEFADLMDRLLALWPNAELPKETLAVYWEELQHFDYEVACVIVRTLSREGREFVPPAGVIFQKLATLEVDAPPWPITHRWLRKLNRIGYHAPGEPDPTRRQADRELREQMPPLIRAFVKEVGGGYLYDALDNGGNGEARVKSQWEQYVADCLQQRLLVGLPVPEGAELHAIERANRNTAPEPMADVIRAALPSSE